MTKNLSIALVLDANQRSALAVTRSLGKIRDLTVMTADSTADALAAHSRYSQTYIQYPSIYESPEQFNNWLLSFVKQHNVGWIFPVTEVSSQTILQLRDQLDPCQIPFADIDTIMQLADKWRLIQLAKTLEVPHPASLYFSSSTTFDSREITQYPIVLKPCLSRIRTASGWLETNVHIATDPAGLAELLAKKPYLRDHPFIIQEFIPGHGAGIFALYSHGTPVTFFAHRRIREKPPGGGVSTLSESVKPNEKMLSLSRKLLDAVAWHGVAMVEFRVSPDGTPYLMETNTRFWGSLQLAIDSGVDFPQLLYQASKGDPITPLDNYKIGKRLRWLLGDIDSLYLTLREKQHFSNWEKLSRTLSFFIPHPFSTRHEINRLDDLAPAWFELRRYIASLFD